MAAAISTSCAQGIYVIQFFDYDDFGWQGNSPVTLAWDSSQDNTGDWGGSCHVNFDLSGNGIFDVNVYFGGCGPCDNCAPCDSVILVNLTNYAALSFDVKWDNSSTVTPAEFNADSILASDGLAVSLCYSNVLIPDAATNGWAHVSAAINPLVGVVTGMSINGEFTANGTGKAAFWLDNVELVSTGSPRFVTSALQHTGKSLVLQWTANPGSTCTVLKSTNLTNWSTLVTGYPTGGLKSTTCSYTDLGASNRQAYYRITVP